MNGIINDHTQRNCVQKMTPFKTHYDNKNKTGLALRKQLAHFNGKGLN